MYNRLIIHHYASYSIFLEVFPSFFIFFPNKATHSTYQRQKKRFWANRRQCSRISLGQGVFSSQAVQGSSAKHLVRWLAMLLEFFYQRRCYGDIWGYSMLLCSRLFTHLQLFFRNSKRWSTVLLQNLNVWSRWSKGNRWCFLIWSMPIGQGYRMLYMSYWYLRFISEWRHMCWYGWVCGCFFFFFFNQGWWHEELRKKTWNLEWIGYV